MAKTKTDTTAKIYERVTNTIIEALEEGTVPWQRPWRSAGPHKNLKSKKSYRGVNQFLLDIAAQRGGYDSPYWVTFKQATEMGGTLKKITSDDEKTSGQKTTMVVFWKIMRFETDERDDQGRKVYKTIPLLRYYNVFNVEQWEGLDGKLPPKPEVEEEFSPIEFAQAIIDNMPEAPVIHHRGDRAFYAHFADEITLPKPEVFDTPADYYSTAYHELIHSTGHEDRTGRVKDWTAFGSEPYAKEELVAEMGASMIAGFVGIEMPLIENSAAYIANWLKRLKDDKKLVVSAAAQAQKAADFIIGPDEEEDS